MYQAPPVIAGYQETDKPQLWRIPFRQNGGTGRRTGYSYATNANAMYDMEKTLRALAFKGGIK